LVDAVHSLMSLQHLSVVQPDIAQRWAGTLAANPVAQVCVIQEAVHWSVGGVPT